MSDTKTLGQVAYEAYCDSTGWRSLVSGHNLPPWGALPAPIQKAWGESAVAVARETRRRSEDAELAVFLREHNFDQV